MIGLVNFCGASGASYGFERIGADQDWARIPGVIVFAAQDGPGWRAISVSGHGGTENDIAAFWRWREARRYGATSIFVRRQKDIGRRREEAADLNLGLDPVYSSGSEQALDMAA
jgi:hypothetical protein